MAYIKFTDKDRARATMLLLINRVPFTCYREHVFELPDYVLDKLTGSGVSYEFMDTPPPMPDNGSRVTVQLVGGVAPTPPAKRTPV